MRTKLGDYVIAKEKGGKPFMLKVANHNENSVSGIIEYNRHIKQHSVDVDRKLILVNLGEKPEKGKVYGIEAAQRFQGTINHPFWGEVHFLVKTTKTERSFLKDSLDRTARKLEKTTDAKYIEGMITEVIPQHGKYAGMYHHSSKEELPSRISYSMDLAQQSPETMDYIVYHEFGHRVWYQGVLSKKMRAAWLRLFNRSIAQVILEPTLLKKLRKDITKFENEDMPLAAVFKEMSAEDDDTKEQLKVILKWFRTVHRLGSFDLAMLWDALDFNTLYSLWPESSIDSSKLDPLVSEYACRNVKELWAEAYAFDKQRKKLPKSVKLMLDTSLSRLQ